MVGLEFLMGAIMEVGDVKQAAVATVAASASKATYAGGTTAAFGWIMDNQFVSFAGLVLAITGFLVNLFFKIKEDRRQQAMHDANMRAMSLKHGAPEAD